MASSSPVMSEGTCAKRPRKRHLPLPAWLQGLEQDRIEGLDHVLFFARVTAVGEGRLGEPPLVYSSRHGWRIADTKAREAGVSVRDDLLARLAESGTT